MREGVPRQLGSAAAGLAALRSGRAAAGAFALGVAHWALMAGMVWLSLAAVGQRLPVAAGAVVNGLIAFAVLVPAAPGYVGVVQAAFRAGTVPFAVPPAAALAASVYYQLTQWVPITAAGGVCAAVWGVGGGTQAAASGGTGVVAPEVAGESTLSPSAAPPPAGRAA